MNLKYFKGLYIKLQSIAFLSEREKIIFHKSLLILKDRLDEFVNSFYGFLLQTKAAELFNLFDMEKQYKMFQVSIAILISHVDNPFMLDKHLQLVVKNHKYYGVKNCPTEKFLN